MVGSEKLIKTPVFTKYHLQFGARHSCIVCRWKVNVESSWEGTYMYAILLALYCSVFLSVSKTFYISLFKLALDDVYLTERNCLIMSPIPIASGAVASVLAPYPGCRLEGREYDTSAVRWTSYVVDTRSITVSWANNLVVGLSFPCRAYSGPVKPSSKTI